MDESWLIRLQRAVRKRPLVVLQFDREESLKLHGSVRGLTAFTIARSHDTLERLKGPTACLLFSMEGPDIQARFGLVGSAEAVSTLESRVKVTRSQRVQPSSKTGLLGLITEKTHSSRLRRRLASADTLTALLPQLSAHLVDKLAEIEGNRGAMRLVAGSLAPSEDYGSMASLQQNDGALKNAGITIPLDRFDRLRTDPACSGPRGPFRISFESLAGRYLRQTAFLDLVRSGYIGGFAVTTAHLKALVTSVVEGDKTVIAAIQSDASVEN